MSSVSAAAPAKSTATAIQDGATLAAVKQRGRLNCGVNIGLAGFGLSTDDGTWIGFDVDYCRAIAAAVFGDAAKVEFRPTSTEQRFVALQSGEVDVLARNSVATLSRDTQLSLDAAAINFFDGQGFLVRRDSNIRSAPELKGASVCVQEGTTTEWNLRNYDKTKGLGISVATFQDGDQAHLAYAAGRCDALTADASYLAAVRTSAKDPDAHVILPERISKEPLALFVRHGDNAWADIVRWTHFAMLTAEELNITSANVDRMRQSSQDFGVRLLLGSDGNMGSGMGLGNDWAYNIIKLVGNYAEVFDRNLGSQTPLRMERGPNALWRDGGLQFAPPIR